MRNSLNVALPVTANFIDPLLGLVKAARLPGKDAVRGKVYGCERVTASPN